MKPEKRSDGWYVVDETGDRAGPLLTEAEANDWIRRNAPPRPPRPKMK